MTPDIWADYNQIDDRGHVVAYLEDIVRPERIVLDTMVVVADPEAQAHTATVVGMSRTGVIALDVDWSSALPDAHVGSAAMP